MEENTIDRQTAESDFERFCIAARINAERYMSDEEAEEFNGRRERFVEGIMRGKILVDDDGWPSVVTESAEMGELRFPRRPKGFDRCVMEKAKLPDNASNSKLFSWIGSVTGRAPKLFQGLEEHDLAYVQCVFFLFRDA